jgi:UDP-N-acetylglucosamine diphosphorylase/glucosamine-1-phosphate N-acetyltransferase
VKLVVYDDGIADDWRPFSLTRPTGEVRFGATTLRERIERWAGTAADGTLTRPWLGGFTEPGAPPALPRAEAPEGDLLLVCSRFVPEGEMPVEPLDARRPVMLVCRGAVIGCRLPAGADRPDADWLAAPEPIPGAREVAVSGRLLGDVWQLVEFGPERLERDIADAATARPGAVGPATAEPALPHCVHRIGEGPLLFGEGVSLEPGVLLDTRSGGIALGAGTSVRAGARLEGPIAVGENCRLLGGAYSTLSAGPRCYLRGEIEETTAFGYVNKAHDGFIGHAVIGRWVNLGALTTNSDLKNTYGEVSLGGPAAPLKTDLVKLGCLLGDHVRTAIGTLLNTGTVVGAGASLFGDRMPPKWVPPFAWGASGEAASYRLEDFLETAATVLGRRDAVADRQVREWWTACWEHAAEGGS